MKEIHKLFMGKRLERNFVRVATERMTKILCVCLSLLLTVFSEPAWAYLDPGTGSMIGSMVIGILATFVFLVKGLYYKGLESAFGLIGKRLRSHGKRSSMVFYSEGRQYWNTFKPVIDEFMRRGVQCTYLTSDVKDPGLLCPSELVTTKYIGEGSQAYRYLSFLEADVCAMTTPGLDVLQIKRSKGVKHYVYLSHSLMDAANYKLYSFDYFDSIFVSGDYQIRSIRKLEELRGTPTKRLINAGCVYYDEMVSQAKNYDPPQKSPQTLTVLVAPTWGPNGLLQKSGARFLVALLDAGMAVILRPHPQSFISEKNLMIDLQKRLTPYSNLEWDQRPDGLKSMAKADVMISDISGAAFDFAFVFEKPVVTVKSEFITTGLDAADLPWDPWELTVLDQIGRQIDEAKLDQLPEILQQEVRHDDRKPLIRQLCETSVNHFSCAAEHVADELLRIQEQVQSKLIVESESSMIAQVQDPQAY